MLREEEKLIDISEITELVHNDLKTLDNAYTLSRCGKTLRSEPTFGKLTSWTRVFLKMNLASVSDFGTNKYLDTVDGTF